MCQAGTEILFAPARTRSKKKVVFTIRFVMLYSVDPTGFKTYLLELSKNQGNTLYRGYVGIKFPCYLLTPSKLRV